LTAAIWGALLTRREPRQGSLFADVLAQAPDVFDRHENSMAFGVVELKILGARPVGCLEGLGSHVAAKSVSGMEYQLTGIEGGGELRWQVSMIIPALRAS